MDKYSRATLRKLLKEHDHTYDWADDHRNWKRGREEKHQIERAIAATNCPFNYKQLWSWALTLHDNLPADKLQSIADAYSPRAILNYDLFLAINNWLRTDNNGDQ